MAFFEILRSYSQMRNVIAAFAAQDSKLGFVVVMGDPGIGKTNTFRKEVPDAFILECTTTPFGLYRELHGHKDSPVLVLDDVDTLAKSPTGLNLLKAVCQTDGVKTVSWHTNAVKQAGLPSSFTTKARVLMFCNTLDGSGPNFEAVLDRAHCFRFQPTAGEVHQEVKGWIDRKEIRTPIDVEVFEFIGQNLGKILKPTFRDYVRASESKGGGLDWRASLRARWEQDPKLSAAAEIVRLAQSGDPAYATAEQRAQKFEEWGHGTRSTYMLYQQQVFQMLGIKRLRKAKAKQAPRPSSDFRTLAVETIETPVIPEMMVGAGN